MAGTRLTSGVTLDLIHQALGRQVIAANIVPASAVWLVLDDEHAPVENPPFQRFVTAKMPSLNWPHGEAFNGQSEFWCRGESQITLWLRNELDLYGRFREGGKEATSPAGGRLLGRLVKAFWESELLDSNGNYVLKRPLLFKNYKPPQPSASVWRPFRLTWELEFTWDLSAGG